MMKPKTAEPQLWKLASELPYKESKFSTIIREFTPSFLKKDYPFNMSSTSNNGWLEVFIFGNSIFI